MEGLDAYLGLPHQRSGDSHALFLSSRQPYASFSDHCIEPLRQRGDKRMDVG